jgi:hypothetical protein
MRAKQAQCRLRDGERIRRIHAQFRKSRGVGFLPGVVHLKHGSGNYLCR